MAVFKSGHGLQVAWLDRTGPCLRRLSRRLV